MTNISISGEASRERQIVAHYAMISWKRVATGTLLLTGLVTAHAGISLLGTAVGLDWMPLHFSSDDANVFYGASSLLTGVFAMVSAIRQRRRWNALDREFRDTSVLRAAFGDDASRPRST